MATSSRLFHISDLHFSASNHTLNWVDDHPVRDDQDSQKKGMAVAAFLINKAREFATNMIVITGDLTDSGDDDDYEIALRFINQLRDAGFTVIVVPGNHDYCKEGNLIFAKVLSLVTPTGALHNLNLLGISVPDSLVSTINEIADALIPDFISDVGRKVLSWNEDAIRWTVEQILPGTPADIVKVIVSLILHPFGDNADNQERRRRFIRNVTGYAEYPRVVNLPRCNLILLDSMEGMLNEINVDDPRNVRSALAQGKLGAPQLSKLGGLLRDGGQINTERREGKKTTLCLHHSPFTDSETGRLLDAPDFLEIIKGKIDCLLMGHIGPAQASEYQNEKSKYGIAVINSENLEGMNFSYPISVIDCAEGNVRTYYAKWAGGTGGGYFTDNAVGDLASREWRIFKIDIHSGTYVDAIEVFYENVVTGTRISAGRHGGDGGRLVEIWLGPGEYISDVVGRCGHYVDSISVKTNKKIYGPYGGAGGGDYAFSAKENEEVIGFYGQSGEYLDGFSVITRKRFPNVIPWLLPLIIDE